MTLPAWLARLPREEMKDAAALEIISLDLRLYDTENDSEHLKRHHQASLRRFWISLGPPNMTSMTLKRRDRVT